MSCVAVPGALVPAIAKLDTTGVARITSAASFQPERWMSADARYDM